MTDVINIVDLSDDEDDDCVIESVVYKKKNKISSKYRSSLYHKVSKDSTLLANFIENCLNLEKSSSMFNTLKNVLLDKYYKVEKSVRDGSKIQRALQRANNLLNSDPVHKYTHIKDLCEILKASQVKKKVPFITLSTDLKATDNKSKRNNLKRNNKDPIDAESSKKSKLNGEEPLEITNLAFDDTADSLDESMSTVNCSQESCVSEEDSLLIAKKDSPVQAVEAMISTNEEHIRADSSKKPILNTEIAKHTFNDTADSLDESVSTVNCSQESCVSEEDSLLVAKRVSPVKAVEPMVSANEEQIKKLRRKIAYYKREIARLDELEVDDDSINSPYVRSERLKSSVVVLYKQLCALIGSKPAKRKGIRLQVIEGHPPGPTKFLEEFLNKNIDSKGDLPFPDFCDVVNCVTEASDKDDLGWTKAQILKEAYLLFTHCGRALQKRRQKHEYRDLLFNVKLEDFQKDPADDDPELMARLEENKQISIKKESEILERYTMMQNLPSKTKSQKKTENSTVINANTDIQKILGNNNHNSSKNNIEPLDVDTDCESQSTMEQKENQSKTNFNLKLKADVPEEPKRDTHIEFCNKDTINRVVDKVFSSNQNKDNNEVTTSSLPEDTQTDLAVQSDVSMCDSSCIEDEMRTESMNIKDTNNESVIVANDNWDGQDNEIIKIASEDKSTCLTSTEKSNLAVDSCSGEDKENNEINMLTATEIKQEPEEDIMSMFKGLGENFSVTVETISDPFLIIEISSDSSEEE